MIKKLFAYICLLFSSYQVLATHANRIEHFSSMLQPEQIHEDIDLWHNWLNSTHPDLSYTVSNVDKLDHDIEALKNSITAPISVGEFWRRISLLNRQFSDGHTVITIQDWQGFTKELLTSGNALFPFEVVFNGSELVIAAKLGGEQSNLSGYVITEINDERIENILASLNKRLHGDSAIQRNAILERRFALYYWLNYGNQSNFVLKVSKKHEINNITVAASSNVPRVITSNEQFEDIYHYENISESDSEKIALLTIKSFMWPDRDKYFSFMESTFEKVKNQKIDHLIIDIRENGGGDDDMWKRGIMPYIADKSWRFASKYKKKVIAGRESDTEKLGDVILGEVDSMVPVDADNPHKFNGKVSILIGPYTYSSSILFTNTVQDHSFGKLVGTTSGGKSGQTGGTQIFNFPHSKLIGASPRFMLERPNGGRQLELVSPDITIDYDPTQPEQLIEKLILLQKH